MSVKPVNSDAEFPVAIKAAGQKLVVVDFYADWCGPCKTIAPVFSELAIKYHATCVFLKVNFDACKTTAQQFGITSIPTFLFFKNGKKVDQFSGADAKKILECINKHLGDTDSLVPGHGDLAECISKKDAECLNQSEHHTISGIFDDNELYLESDADEQMIISIPFNQPVKIHSLDIRASNDGRGPKNIKIFCNPTSVPDFDECENLTATQEMSLTPRDLAESTLTSLVYVKYQNVNKLVIFVENNQGDEETSVISYIRLIGSPVASTDMKEFKRVAGEAGERHG